MHPGQLVVTVQMVERLVREQFPAWAGSPVSAVRSHGTVNALFRIGNEFVARLPLVPGDAERKRRALEEEAEAARRLRAVSPYPTPEPVAIGSESEEYPLPWAVYRWLPGTISSEAGVAGSVAFAQDLAEFVLALRGLPTEGRTFAGSGRGGRLLDHDEDVLDGLERSRGMIDVDAVIDLWTNLRTTPRTEPDTWTHGDLMPGNLLAADGRLTGIVDVGQFGPADPALDLQPAWNFFTPEARAAFRTALACSDDEWRRGMAWSLAQATGCLWYYRETNPVMSQTAHHTLTALLTDQRS